MFEILIMAKKERKLSLKPIIRAMFRPQKDYISHFHKILKNKFTEKSEKCDFILKGTKRH